MALLQRLFPEHWSSFRSFEFSRTIYNIACKYEFFDEFKSELGRLCDFLNPELNTETALSIIKELYSMVSSNMANGMNAIELKYIFLEFAIWAVHDLAVLEVVVVGKLCVSQSRLSWLKNSLIVCH